MRNVHADLERREKRAPFPGRSGARSARRPGSPVSTRSAPQMRVTRRVQQGLVCAGRDDADITATASRSSAASVEGAFERRRSGVRLSCGPPMICREIVPCEPSVRLSEGPAATILQPKSMRPGGTDWGLVGLVVTTRPPSRPRRPTRLWPAIVRHKPLLRVSVHFWIGAAPPPHREGDHDPYRATYRA